ncbi:hypothetical protein PHLGIDRAFT_452244 [Phlebiopsis gigantea 11061_1 CR5-6]|uniref:Concanavalin A-like lectin/glucanase n=1 Tax=Phlebiopsis gigantea (strain 11061_1 CR5-6) TaxID=745531 RepID=A0A0C3S737_PHLG1|nr:hypothetical protein PHLGIDRAFT_452244 [Phlebiopsis gigantea 11061_1 CR5-6]
MFISNILIQVLFAAAAVAVPTTHSLGGQLAARTDEASPPHIFDLDYAGAFISGQKNEFNQITAEFNVPSAKPPAGNPIQSAASAVIGFDRFTNSAFFLVVGTRIALNRGATSYTNFYEWTRRDGLVVARGTFPDVNVKANDELRILVQATSATSAVLTLTKNSGEQTQTQRVSVPGAALNLQEPDWFVRAEGSLPLARIGDVAYDGAHATEKSGATVGPLDDRATVVNIRRGDVTVTETDLGGESVTIRFTQ